jgi:hypothetical protein
MLRSSSSVPESARGAAPHHNDGDILDGAEGASGDGSKGISLDMMAIFGVGFFS